MSNPTATWAGPPRPPKSSQFAGIPKPIPSLKELVEQVDLLRQQMGATGITITAYNSECPTEPAYGRDVDLSFIPEKKDD